MSHFKLIFDDDPQSTAINDNEPFRLGKFKQVLNKIMLLESGHSLIFRAYPSYIIA